MKKNILLFAVACIIAVTGKILSSCTEAKGAKLVDVVHGTTPMDPAGMNDRSSFISSLRLLSPADRKAKIDQAYPRLCGQLFRNLHAAGFTCKPTSVSFVFGSGNADSVSSGDGLQHSGSFTDELIAVVKGPCFKTKDSDSVCVFVACFNGTFYLNGKLLENIGSYSPVFTVEKGYGFNHYVDYSTAIWIAERFNIPIHEGQGWGGKLITPTKARELVDKLGEKAVTVECNPGDIIDLGSMTYTNSSGTRQAVP